MTVFCDEREALTGLVCCVEQFHPGDYVAVRGVVYLVGNETMTRNDESDIRVVNLKRSQRQKFPRDFVPKFAV